MERCPWCLGNEKMIRYHDEEWGVPVHDDQKQFEFLMMEVMQCGLNWNMMIHAYTGPAAPSARNFSPTLPEGSPTSRK